MTYDTMSGKVQITQNTYTDRPTIRFEDFLPVVSTLPVVHEGKVCWVFQHTMDEYIYLYKPSDNCVVRFNSTIAAEE